MAAFICYVAGEEVYRKVVLGIFLLRRRHIAGYLPWWSAGYLWYP